MDVKIKNLSVTYYQHGRCKTLREFIVYHCWQSISLRIAERHEQIDIKTK